MDYAGPAKTNLAEVCSFKPCCTSTGWKEHPFAIHPSDG
jgi:hypothetical protein